MKLRPLGRSGLQVSPLCLGGNVFGWTIDEATSFTILDAWLDAGMNFVDTADVYSIWAPGHAGGESETIVGKWLKRSGKRDRVVLATKVGKPMGESKSGLSKAYIRSAVEASLERLQTDDFINVKVCQTLFDVSEITARRDLAELYRVSLVQRIGKGRATQYRLSQSV